MRENRPRHRMQMSTFPSIRGRTVTDVKEPIIECRILDISAVGACLELVTSGALPGRFELISAGSKKKCPVVWRRGYRVGVSF